MNPVYNIKKFEYNGESIYLDGNNPGNIWIDDKNFDINGNVNINLQFN